MLQVSFASEITELVQERDSLLAACTTAEDTAAEVQQQNRYCSCLVHAINHRTKHTECLRSRCHTECLCPAELILCKAAPRMYTHCFFSHFSFPSLSLKKQAWCRELHDRLRSLVGGAITRMAREKACKGQMASLESQLHLLQVCACFTLLAPCLMMQSGLFEITQVYIASQSPCTTALETISHYA